MLFVKPSIGYYVLFVQSNDTFNGVMALTNSEFIFFVGGFKSFGNTGVLPK